MKKSESIKQITVALLRFQASVAKIGKDGNNPFFKSKYATLSNILDTVQPELTEQKLAVAQFPDGEGLTTILTHESGEWMEATYTLTPVKNDPQGWGSAITYARRYALSGILGLNIDDDDDGNKASYVGQKVGDGVYKEIADAKNKDELEAIWSNNKNLHKDRTFIGAVKSKKEKINGLVRT